MVFNGVQFHLLVNHIPVIGFTGMVLALIAALLMRSRDVKKFVLLATAVVGFAALPSLWTGEAAEELVEHLPGVSESLIHDHEEMGEKATILAVITGAVAALAFFAQTRRPALLDKSIPLILLLALLNATVMGITAHKGGKIRHPQLSPQD